MESLSSDLRPGPGWARTSIILGIVLAALPADAFVRDLEAIAAPMGSVYLRWEDITDGETGFRIERKYGDSDYVEVAVVPANAIHYTDTGLLPGREVTYSVQALSPDRELPVREVQLATLPDWESVALPRPSFKEVKAGNAVFSFEGAGQTYSLEKSTDLSAWAAAGEPVVIAPFEEGEIIHPVGDPAFYRVLAEGYERPLAIGLDRPFEVPPVPTGEIYDVTDFGASPLVAGNDDATGIKVALSIAAPGDIVFIPAGTYVIRQVLEIPSGVTLRGAGMDETILVTEEIDRAVHISPEFHDIRIEDFAITYLGDTEELLHGVYVGSSRQGRNSYRILIDGLRIQRFSVHAVSLRDSNHVLVQNCHILNATNEGGGGHGYGVALNYPTNHNNWVRDNVIGPGIRHAVLLQYFAHNNLVEGNLATGNSEDAYDLHGEDEYLNELRFNVAENGDRDGFGVGNTGSTHDRSGPNNWIHHNTVRNSLYGVEIIQDSDVVFIDHNTFENNVYGIRVHNLGGNQIYLRGNIIDSNEIGISLNSASNVWILDNTISNQSAYGIEILAGVENLVQEGNVLSGNVQDYRP